MSVNFHESIDDHLLLENFLDNFYKAISFYRVNEFDAGYFASLFTKDASITNTEKSVTINQYIEEFTTIMREFPHIFKYGFIEQQINYTYTKKDNTIRVDSHYKKAYNKSNETGINHMQIIQLNDQFYISAITYEEF